MYDAPVEVQHRKTRRHVLAVDEEELVACVACGLCLPHCPTYRVTGLEAASPRGRIAAMRAVELDGAPVDDAFRRTMETCVQCRGCEVACPSGVPFGHLMEGARESLAHAPRPRRRGLLRRVAEWLGYVVVLPRHWLLLALTWPTWLAQRLRLVPKRFGLPTLSLRSLRAPLRGAANPDAFLFPGCVMDAWQRDVHRAALTVMRRQARIPGSRDQAATAAARCTCTPDVCSKRVAWPVASSRRCRVMHRSSSTARGAARR